MQKATYELQVGDKVLYQNQHPATVMSVSDSTISGNKLYGHRDINLVLDTYGTSISASHVHLDSRWFIVEN